VVGVRTVGIGVPDSDFVFECETAGAALTNPCAVRVEKA
jgi:hypothetical protein